MLPFLERVADVLRPALEEAGIALAVQAAPGAAEIEPDLMESVCLNLLDNARKALDAGGRILLEGTQAEGGYCIHVTDNGRGIAPEDLNRITEPFYMADKSRSRAQGVPVLGSPYARRSSSFTAASCTLQAPWDKAPGSAYS